MTVLLCNNGPNPVLNNVFDIKFITKVPEMSHLLNQIFFFSVSIYNPRELPHVTYFNSFNREQIKWPAAHKLGGGGQWADVL